MHPIYLFVRMSGYDINNIEFHTQLKLSTILFKLVFIPTPPQDMYSVHTDGMKIAIVRRRRRNKEEEKGHEQRICLALNSGRQLS